MIDGICLFQDNYLNALDTFPKRIPHEKECLMHYFHKFHERGKILEYKASNALLICLEVDKLISNIIKEFGMPPIHKEGDII